MAKGDILMCMRASSEQITPYTRIRWVRCFHQLQRNSFNPLCTRFMRWPAASSIYTMNTSCMEIFIPSAISRILSAFIVWSADRLRIKLFVGQGNILVDEGMHVHIADFGLASVEEPETSSAITIMDHTSSGRWSAPELMEEGAMCSYASDVWAFGCACLLVSSISDGEAILLIKLSIISSVGPNS